MPRRSNLSLQYENQIYGSMMLLLDHMLLRNGGYSSKTVSFYEDTDSTWSSIYTYTSPYKQFGYDEDNIRRECTFSQIEEVEEEK